MTQRIDGSLLERLEGRLRFSDTGCWEWTGYVDERGYGRINQGGGVNRMLRVHRAAWTLLVGPIPKGLELDHLCRNTRCANPDHLEPVTHSENVRRGFAPAGVNARKETCKRGHRFDHVNTLIQVSRSGARWRICRACYSEDYPGPPPTCPQGHPFDEANTRYDKRGWRRCHLCAVASQRRRRAMTR